MPRMITRVVVGCLILIAAAAIYAFTVAIPAQRPRAQAASGYIARVACACHFIGKRTLESCMTDKEPGTEMVRVSVDPAAKRVTAGVPLVATASATYKPGLGCSLDP